MSPAADEASRAVFRRVEALFVAHVSAVFNVAYRVLWNRSDAEDVVQATFVKALTRLDQLNDTTRSRPWLLQVAYRESIAVVRKRRELPLDPIDLPESNSLDLGPEESAVLSEVAAELSQALGRLDDDERMALVLRDVEGLPMRDVADVLGIGLSAAKMRVHRGRQSLRLLLHASGIQQ